MVIPIAVYENFWGSANVYTISCDFPFTTASASVHSATFFGTLWQVLASSLAIWGCPLTHKCSYTDLLTVLGTNVTTGCGVYLQFNC